MALTVAAAAAEAQQEADAGAHVLEEGDVQLLGHRGGVLSVSWGGGGALLASAGAAGEEDGVLLWALPSSASSSVSSSSSTSVRNVCQLREQPQGAGGDSEGGAARRRRTGALTKVCWRAFSGPGEESIAVSEGAGGVTVWDVRAERRTARFKARERSGGKKSVGVMNDVCWGGEGSPLLAAVADDGGLRVYDVRDRSRARPQWHVHTDFPLLCVALKTPGAGPSSGTATQPVGQGEVFAAGVEEGIWKWDMRVDRRAKRRGNGSGHPTTAEEIGRHDQTITGAALSPLTGNFLLTNGMDSTLRSWDVRPFVDQQSEGGAERSVKRFTGLRHGFERNLLRCTWSADEEMVAGGSADGHCYIWDVFSGEQLYVLPGHKGSVNDIALHPTMPLIASCSSDKSVLLGELG